MRKSIIAGNWKMHGNKASSIALVQAIEEGAYGLPGIEIAVFPPFIYIDAVANNLANETPLSFGAQNVAATLEGAYTGEVSAYMLADLNCRYVLVGHSERRRLFGEDNKTVAQKFLVASEAGIKPILCVGETFHERKNHATRDVIKQQLDAVLHNEKGVSYLNEAVIAYEPVWAIGTGEPASPEQAQEIHNFIREYIAGYNEETAAKLPILYGGSIKASNAAELFLMHDIDGGLVGGASLDAVEFLEICRCSSYS